VFRAFESLRVLSFKLELAAFLRYCIVGAGVSWLAAQLPLETPWIAALAKGTLILVLYVAILCVIDARVRGLFRKIWSMTANWLRRPAEPAEAPIDALSAASERT